MTQIRAIATRYKGCHFRSRLEARWAVFLDHLGVPWQFETEGYEFPDGTRYLPDFWLPESKVFLEIKRDNLDWNERDDARYKAEGLSIYEGQPVLLASGHPGAALFEWYARDRRKSHIPHAKFVAMDYDEAAGLPILWDAQHEPIYDEPLTDPWGRTLQFASYSAGFFASSYLICHPEHASLKTRRRKELVGVVGPEGIPLSARAIKAIAAAKSARFEFGESGAS